MLGDGGCETLCSREGGHCRCVSCQGFCRSLIPYALTPADPCAGAASARVLDGKGVAAAWQAEIAREVQQVTADLGRPPGLAVVLVGERPDSQIYVHRKHEACQRVRRLLGHTARCGVSGAQSVG